MDSDDAKAAEVDPDLEAVVENANGTLVEITDDTEEPAKELKEIDDKSVDLVELVSLLT